jgi:hypothetical protein
MRVRYTLTRLDLFRAGFRSLISQRILWLFVSALAAFTWWNTFTYEETQKEPPGVRILIATFSAATGLGVGLVAGAVLIAAQSFFRRDQGVLGEHTLEITDEGLIESTAVNRSVFHWTTSFRIRETKRYARIYVSDSNYHLVPKFRPPSEGSADGFLHALRAKIKQTQQGTPPPIPYGPGQSR